MKTKEINLSEITNSKEIRRELMESTQPSMMQKMRLATANIKNGTPSLEDYRLVMQWPALASMFMRNSKN